MARSVIITGDDFGISSPVNRAILEAHERGVLTSASLMVTGAAADEAIALAHRHPTLAIGLHLVLVSGRSALPHAEIPHLVDRAGRFPSHPAWAGFRYQVHPATRRELRREIRAQLEAFRRTGLTLSHVDGHRNLHLPPVVLTILAELAEAFGIRAVRLPSEELGLALALDRRGWLRKLAQAGAFQAVRVLYAQRRLAAAGLAFPERVYGVLQHGRMSETYLVKLIPRIRASRVEIYSHLTTEDAASTAKPRDGGATRAQLDALLSPRVREALRAHGFRLATYREDALCACPTG